MILKLDNWEASELGNISVSTPPEQKKHLSHDLSAGWIISSNLSIDTSKSFKEEQKRHPPLFSQLCQEELQLGQRSRQTIFFPGESLNGFRLLSKTVLRVLVEKNTRMI